MQFCMLYVKPRLRASQGREGAVVRHGVAIGGASAGAARAAGALRAEGSRGPVTLVGEDPGPPCDRPPLSKQVLSGAWAPERAALLTARGGAGGALGLW